MLRRCDSCPTTNEYRTAKNIVDTTTPGNHLGQLISAESVTASSRRCPLVTPVSLHGYGSLPTGELWPLCPRSGQFGLYPFLLSHQIHRSLRVITLWWRWPGLAAVTISRSTGDNLWQPRWTHEHVRLSPHLFHPSHSHTCPFFSTVYAFRTCNDANDDGYEDRCWWRPGPAQGQAVIASVRLWR